MNESAAEARGASLAALPSVDEVLHSEGFARIADAAGPQRSLAIARDAVRAIRERLTAGNGSKQHDRAELLSEIVAAALQTWHREIGRRTRRVINATGVIVHTNLGRAPLSAAAIDALANEASGYATVEYDLDAGRRGRRGERCEALVCQLTGAEGAIIVNNCAAAAYMILRVFAAGREVVISRGELVEIGGDFRVPDVLVQSGAVLCEVGTTNRTKLRDFAGAITERTAMLLRVHPSNYRITGFTEMPTLTSLAELANERGILLYEDAGSGVIADSTSSELSGEPVISRSIAAGADLVSFSGDKLLGGPQAGIIVGRGDLIDKLRADPLYRAMRVSKLTYAALEATLDAYARRTEKVDVPVQRMIAAMPHELEERTRNFVSRFSSEHPEAFGNAVFEMVPGESVVGGGAAPGMHAATTVMGIKPKTGSSSRLERALRMSDPPVIVRMHEGRVIADLRTVAETEESELAAAIASALAKAD